MSKLKIVKNMSEVRQLIEHCLTTRYCSFDFETTALEYYEKHEKPTVLGISFQAGSSWVVPLCHKESPFLKNNKWKKVLRLIGRKLMENFDVVKIAWNFKFEYKWMKRFGIKCLGRCFDAQLAKYCLDEERPNDLKSWVDKLYPQYGHYEQALHKIKAKVGGWKNIPLQDLAIYCGIDCDLTGRLMGVFEKKLIDNNFYNLFRNLLMMAVRVLGDSEYEGMIIDREYLMKLMKEYQIKIAQCEKQLNEVPALRKFNDRRRKRRLQSFIEDIRLDIEAIRKEGKPTANRLIANREAKISGYMQGKFNKKEAKLLEPLNWKSPDQVIDFFYKSKIGLKLPIIKYTVDKKTKKETDRPSTDEDVLTRLESKDSTGTIKALLEYRGLTKLDSTYITGMYEMLGSDDKVHANFKIFGTVTGRLSCEAPNLQNIPRGTTAGDIKKMFIPPPGYLLFEVDYSQAELRVVAEIADDVAMIDIFRKNWNIHVATACKINGGIHLYDMVKAILKDENHKDWLFWEKQKKRAKTINFGILYGQTEKKLSKELECTEDEAKEFIKQWYAAYPQVAKWIKRQKKYAHKHGYVRSLFGRKRRLYNIYSEKFGVVLEAERQAVNTPIQGTASDFGLLSQIVIRDLKLRGKLPMDMIQVATVHDSILFYIQPKDIHKVVPYIVEICNNPNTLEYFGFEMKKVRMKVSPEIGRNWFDKHDYNPEENYKAWLTQ